MNSHRADRFAQPHAGKKENRSKKAQWSINCAARSAFQKEDIDRQVLRDVYATEGGPRLKIVEGTLFDGGMAWTRTRGCSSSAESSHARAAIGIGFWDRKEQMGQYASNGTATDSRARESDP